MKKLESVKGFILSDIVQFPTVDVLWFRSSTLSGGTGLASLVRTHVCIELCFLKDSHRNFLVKQFIADQHDSV